MRCIYIVLIMVDVYRRKKMFFSFSFVHHFNRLNCIDCSSSYNSLCMVKIYFHILDETTLKMLVSYRLNN
jgi:hypothetical protein